MWVGPVAVRLRGSIPRNWNLVYLVHMKTPLPTAVILVLPSKVVGLDYYAASYYRHRCATYSISNVNHPELTVKREYR